MATSGPRARSWSILAAIASINGVVAGAQFGLAAAGPQLRDGLDLGTSQLGLLLATAPAGLMFGTFAWGVLADRVGERRVLTIACSSLATALLAATGIAWAAWAQHPSGALVATFGAAVLLAGFAGSAAHSAGGRAIVQAFPAHRHGRVLAIRHTMIPVGGTLGAIAVPSLIHLFGLAGALGVFTVAAVGTLVGVRRTLPRWSPEDRVGDADAAFDSAADGEVAGALPLAGPRGSSPLRSVRLWLLGSSCALLALVQLGLASFLTTYLVDEAGQRVAVAATIFAVAQLGGAAARISMGDLADRLGDPAVVLVAIAGSSLATLVAAVLLPDVAAGWVLAGTLFVTTSWNGVAVAAAARLAPEGRTGATLGMQTTMFATMGVVAPIATGATVEAAGWTPVLLGAALALVAACTGLTALRARMPAASAAL